MRKRTFLLRVQEVNVRLHKLSDYVNTTLGGLESTMNAFEDMVRMMSGYEYREGLDGEK